MLILTCPILILAFTCVTNAYKILVVFPLPLKSHLILGSAVVKHLAKAGHEVTFITTFTPDESMSNVTVIDVGEKFKEYAGGTTNIKALMDNTGHSDSIFWYVPTILKMYKLILEYPKVRQLITDKNQHFDAVIVTWMYSEVFAGLAGVFNCPLIWYSTLEPHWMILELTDEIPNPAYTVTLLSHNDPPLTFIQRVSELLHLIVGKLLQVFWISRLDNELYEKYLIPVIRNRGHAVPSLDALKNNVSLILSNSHVSMGSSFRLPPNFIPIGGYHIESHTKPLPAALQKLMDNSKHGVIYFSMGSNLRSKHFPDEIKRELLKVFGKLKQTVLWKFEENLPNRTANVHILQWAPQQSILAHKNCVLFITHGGQLSTTETIHYGVPTIGIPTYIDQFINVERSAKNGFAIKVDLAYNMAANLELAIEEILNNPMYAAKAKELSLLYHDRPIPPGKELVHWVEHVVKTRGALHLRPAAFMTPWYQKLYLDLIVTLLILYLVVKFFILFIKNKKNVEKCKNN